MDVFVSVGTGLSAKQEEFVSLVEARLRAAGLNPHTIGRNTFSTEAPLKAVSEVMDKCAGAVVLALERYHFPNGVERPDSDREKELKAISFPTAWNQIEAAMAYSRKLPLLVLVDEKLKCEGLLEKGNDWYVHSLDISAESLNSAAFSGLMGSWQERLSLLNLEEEGGKIPNDNFDPSTMTTAELVGALKPAHLWALLVAAATALSGAFS
ncbi:hypothetical protein [Sphingorhabdus sp. Alg239-R122]|uniref:hypothetical protein n=1 Tax=Sphingorhabdus sp. Alg239-R122 TaxID=2305989 RepID=UPI0013DBEE7D|nr:hypothetical protein [Sphingorhabdus sp. Alg239-R122]